VSTIDWKNEKQLKRAHSNLQVLNRQLHIRILPRRSEFGFRLLGFGLLSLRL
jgi:hypothetical protein